MMLQQKEYKHYRMAILVCLVMMFMLALFVAIYGKQNSFLAINGFHSFPADYFFTYYTYMGDGLVVIPVFIYVLLYKRPYLVALVAAIIFCTLITHFCKRVIYAGELRPLRALPQLARAIPLLQGKDVYINSFPSGHTSMAFTLALLLAIIINKNWAAFVFPLLAFFVGYSRVYLAQHFVTDVVAGIGVGLVSSYLSLLVYLYAKKKFQQRANSGG